jgi:hypothetical protein
MLRDVKLKHLLGPFKAKGIYDPKIQGIVQRHCERGMIAEIAEVVARYFYDDGLALGYIPQPVGVKTKELLERVADAAKRVAEGYGRRGTMCAKGYYPAQRLMLDIIRIWEDEFHSVAELDATGLPGTYDAEGTTKEFIDRSTVAANAIAKALVAKLKQTTVDGEQVLLLPMRELEGVCSSSVRAMYLVFTKPDEYIHEQMHGEKPSEER